MGTYTGDLLSTQANTGFMYEQSFINAYSEVTKTDTRGYLGKYDIRWRIHTILWAAEYASKLEGDFVDVGGGFGFFMSSIYSYLNFQDLNKTYYMLDSFKGLDPRTRESNRGFDKLGDWYQDVVTNHGSKQNLKIIRGYIPETLIEVTSDKISFVSIDLNSARPEIQALELLWSRVIPGGIIVFDDYGFPGCEGQREAHNSFASSNGLKILSLPTGQGILLKV